MNTRAQPFVLPTKARVADPRRTRSTAPLGQILVDIGELDPGDMLRAVAMREREEVRLGTILLANGMVSEAGLYRGLALQFNCEIADLAAQPPDIRLIDLVGVERCLKEGFTPWRRVGARCVIVTSQPDQFARIRPTLPAELGEPMLALAPGSHIFRALVSARCQRLVARAEARVPEDESCRSWSARAAARYVIATITALIAFALVSPRGTFLLLCAFAFSAVVVNTLLKLAAATASLPVVRRQRLAFRSARPMARHRLPIVSILVPLFCETAIAGNLMRRLSRLNYPRELLDICLIVEEDDWQTRKVLSGAERPAFMRVVSVPGGTLKTKPRALNFALDFCRGSIIGVYDAEDAPEPDQIHNVVRHFREAGPDVACLQGVLDFYNSRSNWLARCFTIEYASWFRVILPGFERLGFVIPLGGTTLFLRRDALEEIGGWDAHNVTEDADLGVRLARRGYRTELIRTVTEEEANCRLWPWVRQRSRWLKGYVITWAVHMRHPLKLLRELGLWRFAGVQVLFLGTLTQFLLAPVLWTFWALPLGLAHPFAALLTHGQLIAMTVTFLVAEAVTLGIGLYATAGQRHRWLWPWVVTLQLYFPLATLACLKGLWELALRPFYWDKTEHGVGPAVRSRGLHPASGASRKPG